MVNITIQKSIFQLQGYKSEKKIIGMYIFCVENIYTSWRGIL